MSRAHVKAGLSPDLIGHDPELAEALAELREGLEADEDALYINLGRREPDREAHPELPRELGQAEPHGDSGLERGREEPSMPCGTVRHDISEESAIAEAAHDKTNPDAQGPEFILLPPTYVPPRELPARRSRQTPLAHSVHVRETAQNLESSKPTVLRAPRSALSSDGDLSGLAWPSALSKFADPLTPAGPNEATVVKPRPGPKLVLWAAFGLATLLLGATLLVRGVLFPKRNIPDDASEPAAASVIPRELKHVARAASTMAPYASRTNAPAPALRSTQTTHGKLTPTPATGLVPRRTAVLSGGAASPAVIGPTSVQSARTESARNSSPRSAASPRPPHPEPEF